MFGSQVTQNNLNVTYGRGYEGVQVFRSLDVPSLDLLRTLETDIKTSPNETQGDFLDGLVVGMH